MSLEENAELQMRKQLGYNPDFSPVNPRADNLFTPCWTFLDQALPGVLIYC
jgi:hypothetical protein